MTEDPGRVEITGLTADSRAVEPGYLFAALPGSRTDGRRFIAEAIGRGAAAILAPPGTSIEGVATRAPLLTDSNPRRRLALMAARFYGAQPRTVAAVTGTNGKTSVAVFTRQLWTGLGIRAASLGTLGISSPAGDTRFGLTTLDPVELHRILAELAHDDVNHLALEASSHGLDQYRLDGVRVSAAAFTNLSRDHLDYHPDMTAYLAAKARLFEELMPEGGAAVLNADIPEYKELAAISHRRSHRIIAYGEAADPETGIRLEARQAHPDGLDIAFTLFGHHHRASLGLVGAFQADNVLCALGLVAACDPDDGTAQKAARLLSRLEGAPGRLQRVATSPRGGAVFVDYAHTPGALETVLTALRPHVRGRLVCVFGAGGARDPGKRPMMGEVVARLADQAVVTDDNPRSEDPGAIRAAILAACPGAEEIGDREAAIRAGLEMVGPNDLLLLAGKGHEPGQIIGDRTLPFDDAEVARRLAGEVAS